MSDATADHGRSPCNIVICSDGTGNAGGRTNGSNVWRIRQAVADQTIPPEGETARPQIVIYEDGVGSETVTPLKVLGGAFGLGITRDLKSLYGRLIREFQPGDQIYLFGFSRGAFTARTLANILHLCGIADCWYEDEHGERARRTPEQIDAIVDQAILAYKRRHRNPNAPRDFRLAFGREWPTAGNATEDQPTTAPRERGRFPIRFVGMWDTVDALGLPFDNVTQCLANQGIPLFRLNLARRGDDWQHWEDDLHADIQNAYHALSVDDERQTFHPVLWLENEPVTENGKTVLRSKNKSDYRYGGARKVEQVWFSGMHANVGGGYPKDQLSHVSLCWMMRHAAREGLQFDMHHWQEYEQERDELGRLYDSRMGLAAFYRYKPRRITELAGRAGIEERSTEGHSTRPPLIHSSVLNRVRWSTRGYAPTGLSLDGDYKQVGDPQLLPAPDPPCQRQFQIDCDGAATPEIADSSWPLSDCPANKCDFCSVEQPHPPAGCQPRAEIQKNVFDLVALRRVLFYFMYFAVVVIAFLAMRLDEAVTARAANVWAASGRFWLVILAGFLLTYLWKKTTHPVQIRNTDDGPQGTVDVQALHRYGRLAFGLVVMAAMLVGLETTVGGLLTSLAPAVIADEVQALTSCTVAFLGSALLLWIVVAGNANSRHGIRELNVHAWQVAFGLRATEPRRTFWLRIGRARRLSVFRWLGSVTERYVAPTVALGVVGMVLAMILYREVAAVLMKSNVTYAQTAPEDAQPDGESNEDEDGATKIRPLNFDTETMLGTSVFVQKGRGYVVSLRPTHAPAERDPVPSDFGWKDATLKAGPEGLIDPRTPVMKFFQSFKRHPDEDYFQLLGTIGSPLGESFPVKSGEPFTAMESGELFLFVNDLPCFYSNNSGKALVTVETK